ncbi:N-acetylmuramoyl-L-alanine amidase [Hutsoniella sourekii]
MTSNSSITISRPGLVLRSKPATNAQKIEDLSEDQEIYLIDQQDHWLKIQTKSHKGWVPQWLIDHPEIQTDQNLALTTKGETTLHKEADSQSDRLAVIPANTELIANFEAGGWIQVDYKDQIGYVQLQEVELMDQSQVKREKPENQTEAQTDLSHLVIVRQSNQAFLSQPDINSEIIYSPHLMQRFKFIESYDSASGEEFYKVEDENGNIGYLESRIAAFGNASDNHIGSTDAKSIAEATIVIDPGHGGSDPGAISDDGQTYEKEVALKSGLMLKEKLEKLGAQVVMTRQEDRLVDFPDITGTSQEAQADIFISMHFDASPVADWHGTTTYYFHEADEPLARAVNNRLKELNLPNNGINFGNYYVLRENTRPSILLELGYMSNQEDFEQIRSVDYHDAMTDQIIVGLEDYFSEKLEN